MKVCLINLNLQTCSVINEASKTIEESNLYQVTKLHIVESHLIQPNHNGIKTTVVSLENIAGGRRAALPACFSQLMKATISRSPTRSSE